MFDLHLPVVHFAIPLIIIGYQGKSGGAMIYDYGAGVKFIKKRVPLILKIMKEEGDD